MKTAVQTTLPSELLAQARGFVDEGWMGNFDELMAEALRRYLESHSARLAERFAKEGEERVSTRSKISSESFHLGTLVSLTRAR